MLVSSISRLNLNHGRDYLQDKADDNNIPSPVSDKSTDIDKPDNENVQDVKPAKREDIYAKMPIRALGYTNELGEAIRPISPLLANLSWLPAIGYISADIADKYRQDEYSNKDTSKGRASKQFVTQLLASVLLPTGAVKIGQSIVNAGAAYTKKGLNINTREKISDVIVNSMKSGEHKNYLDESGKVDKEAYKEALSEKFDEILKHRKTHKKLLRPFEIVKDILTKPIIKKPTAKKVKEYASTIVDRMVDERQNLLDGIKPENLSQKAFKKISALSKNMNAEEKQSMVFDTVRKMEKGRMFNNRVLKSIGGLVSLSMMAKPIDKFVETVIVDKYVSPQIDNISAMYYKQQQARKHKS